MTVNFEVLEPITGWTVTCNCGISRSSILNSHEAAVTIYGTVKLTCDDEYCAAFPRQIIAIAPGADLTVGVSNSNAADLLTNLGFEQDGEIDWNGTTVSGDDLLGRVLLAEGIVPMDEGMPRYQQGSFVNLAREAGYKQLRLAQLRTLAEYAIERNLQVAWS